MEERPETRLPFRVDELLIRRISSFDHHDLGEYLCDPEVARYQFWGAYSPEQVEAYTHSQAELEIGEPGTALVLGTELSGKLIGDCQLTILSLEDRQAEVGFTFNPKFTGRGLATRTVAAVFGFAFIQLNMHRIICATDTRNERSWRLMDRLGMRREANFIHDCMVNEEWVDAYIYAMLDEEWRERYPDLVAVVGLGE
jgi:RimJ/RimL family protein N-acetyltransferase